MKLYWKTALRHDMYVDWFEYTCPSCNASIERNADPPCCCPSCGVRTHGSVEQYDFKTVTPERVLVRKEIRIVKEFDDRGYLAVVAREEKETEVQPDDTAQVFYRRHNLL